MSDSKETEMNIDDIDSDMGEEEIDEELALPALLSDIGHNERKDLLRFKRTHNERDWEEEILRRTDLLARKVDMERLKRMTKGFTVEKPPISGSKKATIHGKRNKIGSDDDDEEEYNSKKRRVSGKVTTATVESDEEGLVGEDNDSEAAEGDDDDEEDDDDDDDELFDSDEEEEISKRFKGDPSSSGAAPAVRADEPSDVRKKSKTLGGKKGKSESLGPRRSNRKVPVKHDDEDDEDDDAVRFGRGEDNLDSTHHKSRRLGLGKKVSKSSRAGGGLDELEEEEDGPSDDAETRDDTDSSSDEATDKVDDSPPATLESYLRIQSRRFVIERWLSEPYLEEVLVGSFVRLFVGEIEGQKVYRMCEVTAVERNCKAYRMPDTAKPVTVRVTVSLAGQDRPKQKIDVVSNSRITANEFRHYQEQVQSAIAKNGGQPLKGVHMLTENQVTARRLRQLKASRHVYTHQEIRAMVAKKSGLNKSLVTEYSTAMESLRKKLDEARAEKEYDSIAAVQKTIELLESESARQKEANSLASRHHIEVNKRSRESNVQRDMAAGMRKRQEDLEAAASGKLSNAVLDPFLRRETRPKILWNTGSKLKNEQAKESGSAEASSALSGAPSGSTVDVATAARVAVVPTAKSGATVSHASRQWAVISGDTSLDEVRRRVKAKLGFDPYSVFLENPRDRYLRTVCRSLPPIGSAGRAQLRGAHKSLEEVVDQVRAHREQGDNSATAAELMQ